MDKNVVMHKTLESTYVYTPKFIVVKFVTNVRFRLINDFFVHVLTTISLHFTLLRKYNDNYLYGHKQNGRNLQFNEHSILLDFPRD